VQAGIAAKVICDSPERVNAKMPAREQARKAQPQTERMSQIFWYKFEGQSPRISHHESVILAKSTGSGRTPTQPMTGSSPQRWLSPALAVKRHQRIFCGTACNEEWDVASAR